jgi:hypothetical protein
VSLMCELFGCRCRCAWLLICFCVLWALLFCSVSVAAAPISIFCQRASHPGWLCAVNCHGYMACVCCHWVLAEGMVKLAGALGLCLVQVVESTCSLSQDWLYGAACVVHTSATLCQHMLAASRQKHSSG